MTPSPHLVRLIRDERFRAWGPGIHLATGRAHFMGIPTWNTTAVIELQRPGALLVWNPIDLSDTLQASLRELQERTGRRVVTLLGALDFHHRALPAWQRAFPEAETWLVSERLRAKRPDVRGEVLDGDRPVVPGAEPDLALLSVQGCLQPIIEVSAAWRNTARREWFVRHVPSRSLLVGDMLFLHDEVSLLERAVAGFRVGFASNSAGFRVGDARAREAFLREVLTWDVDQALTVHGRATARGGDFIRGELTALFGL
jgi:hypothetical protein